MLRQCYKKKKKKEQSLTNFCILLIQYIYYINIPLIYINILYIDISISTSILKYNQTMHLCLYEKLLIATYPNQEELLNKRSELVSKCRHENKFLLKNFKSGD